MWHQTRASRSGRVYTWHFWAYSLAVLPVKMALRIVGGNELAAPQVANAFLLVAAGWFVLLAPWLDRGVAFWWALLSVMGPPAWFCVWPHPEVFTFALVTVAVACAMGARFLPATAAPPCLNRTRAGPARGLLALLAGTRPPRKGRAWPLRLRAPGRAGPAIFYMTCSAAPIHARRVAT